MERARQVKDAEAPFIAERSLVEDAVFVILIEFVTSRQEVRDTHKTQDGGSLLTKLPNKHNPGPPGAPLSRGRQVMQTLKEGMEVLRQKVSSNTKREIQTTRSDKCEVPLTW